MTTRPSRRSPDQRVGLLGGSFNPAHEGHLHISLLALDHLGLDELWWLVSPQNPLKPAHGMAAFEARMAGARDQADDPRIVVSDMERRLGTRYTADTLRALAGRFPRIGFVWVMGADNLTEISAWWNWTAIFETVPIAVFDRPTYSYGALESGAARRYASSRVDQRQARGLAGLEPPAWVFVSDKLHAASATAIREERDGDKSQTSVTKGIIT
ncbi:MAG: nicotinate-nucleotide adenylyltransferase [Alphaproteobacteria bacterium]